jgi:prophage maintenance system killer protein
MFKALYTYQLAAEDCAAGVTHWRVTQQLVAVHQQTQTHFHDPNTPDSHAAAAVLVLCITASHYYHQLQQRQQQWQLAWQH